MIINITLFALAPIPIPAGCIIKTFEYIGVFFNVKRWRSRKRLYTWDSLHGEIEIFDARGYHLGVMDCSGNIIKPYVKGRRIDV